MDDLEQIVVSHWWQVRGRFKAEGAASRETYMRRVMWNRLLDVVESVRAQKRGAGTAEQSLDAPLDSDSEGTLHDVLADDREEGVEQMVLARELRTALARLRGYLCPEDQQLLDALAIDARVHVVSRDLGISPSTAYSRLLRIRRTAESAGLRRFL